MHITRAFRISWQSPERFFFTIKAGKEPSVLFIKSQPATSEKVYDHLLQNILKALITE
jgi:hypothetical protein